MTWVRSKEGHQLPLGACGHGSRQGRGSHHPEEGHPQRPGVSHPHECAVSRMACMEIMPCGWFLGCFGHDARMYMVNRWQYHHDDFWTMLTSQAHKQGSIW